MSSVVDQSRQYSVIFVTKQSEYAIPSNTLNVSSSTQDKQLNSILHALIGESGKQLDTQEIVFDFLIDGKLLREPLGEFIESNGVSSESTIEIEYLMKQKAPSPFNSLLHDDWVSCVDANDKWIISGCYDGTIHIWSLNNVGQHQLAIPAHAAAVKDVKWITSLKNTSVDEKELIFVSTSQDENAIVWKWNEVSNQVEYLMVCRGHTRSVDCVDVRNDLIATGGYDLMLKIWSLTKDDEDDDEGNGDADESKNEKTSNLKRKKLKTGHSNKRTEGTSTSTDKDVTLSDKNRVPILTLSGHSEAVSDCVWLADSDGNDVMANIGTCSMDNTIRIWDIEIGECKSILKGSKAFLSMSYSALNHQVITGSCDRHIRLWDPRCMDGTLVKANFTSHNAWVSSVSWSQTHEHQFMSGAYDQVVKQWDVRCMSAPLYDMLGHEDKVLCVNWANHKYLLSGGADNQLKIYSSSK